MPMLGDANFDRTVVLIVAAEEGGFQGVIISEPTRDDVRSLLPKWWQASMPPRKLHRGGPCSPDMVMCLAVGRPRLSVPGLARVMDYAHQTLYRIEGDVDPESVLPSVGGVRLVMGRQIGRAAVNDNRPFCPPIFMVNAAMGFASGGSGLAPTQPQP